MKRLIHSILLPLIVMMGVAQSVLAANPVYGKDQDVIETPAVSTQQAQALLPESVRQTPVEGHRHFYDAEEIFIEYEEEEEDESSHDVRHYIHHGVGTSYAAFTRLQVLLHLHLPTALPNSRPASFSLYNWCILYSTFRI